MLQRLLRSTARLVSLVLVMASLLTPMTSLPIQAAPADTPVPVVVDNVEEWAVGAGLLYWANNCFAEEFGTLAALKRKPAGGGTERTLESIDDGALCVTYQALLSSGDGLYYFDESQGRIERMPLGEPYVPQVVKALESSQVPIQPLIEADGYLYWVPRFDSKIYRVRKDGSGEVETVADTAPSPADVAVVGNTVYWIDSIGVWSTSIVCGSLPCTGDREQFALFEGNTRGYGLLYQFLGGRFGSYRLYWVQRVQSGPNATYSIHYRACDSVMDCFVLPPEGQLPPPPPTLYTGTVNWHIGDLLLADNNLYWTELDGSNTDHGDVKRKAYNAPGTGAETIATNQANVDRWLYVANDALFFARRNAGIYSLPLNASAIVRDFSIEGMEVTQAIQNLANEAPLIAQKATYVRAYGKQLSGPNAPNVEARLIGLRNDIVLSGSPVQPLNGVRALTTGGYDRARLNDGWYFLLPAHWTAVGAITLKLEFDPRQMHSDPDRTNNELSLPVTFQDQPPVCVWTVPVRTHTALPSTTDPNFWTMVSHFERRWPVPDAWIFRDTEPVEELEVCWYGPIPHPCYGPYELEDGWSLTNGIPDRDKVIASLWGRALLSFNPDACDDIGSPVHFMGMVHPDANNGGAAGYASTVSKQSWVQLPNHTPNPVPAGWNMLREGSTMAQELAHNVGRKHVNCGNPDNVDNSYPYPPCQIANSGAGSYYGFDVTTLQPIRPDQTADFMSYASRSWVSDYTWRALLGSFMTARVMATVPVATDEGNSVFVTGLVDMENDRGEIATVLVLPTASVPLDTRRSLHVTAGADHADGLHATYKLRLLDPVETVLVERTLTLTPLDDHVGDGASALFSDLFPEPAGEVATVQLLADSTVLDSIQPGASAPTVTVEQPTAGTTVDTSLSIRWRADDADPEDRLLFTVQYSHDGGAKWHTLTTNHPSTPDGVYTLLLDELGDLQGSPPDGALIRVLASDGYHTAMATSQPFTVKNRTPEPAILGPVMGQTFAAGETVTLRGRATDPEEGGLAGDALVWFVDGAAAGNGKDVIAAGLTPGLHTAVLTATDSVSNSASAQVDFQIAPLSIPLTTTAPLLDGFCEDSVYAGATAIQLRPYGDGSQAAGRVLRSDDHLWACFSGMQKGAMAPGAFVGLRVDGNHSRDAQAQMDDYGFFVGEDGDVFALAGDGTGGFAAAGPDGLQGQVSAGTNSWSGELRIDQATLGGWGHLVGMNFGHYWVDFQEDDYEWPYATVWNDPSTWAPAALGVQPVITVLDPYTATVNGPALTLSVEGSNHISGTTVLWGETELPTTLVDAEHLTAEVSASQFGSAGGVRVKTRIPGNFESNALTFQIMPLAPVIASLSPASIVAGSPTTPLTINGSDFVPGAQVLWNGTTLAAQFVGATQMQVQLDGSLLELGQTVGVAVRNPLPDARISNVQQFEVMPQQQLPGSSIYLPVVQR